MSALDLGNLDGEHSEIRLRYRELESVILRGAASPRILGAANSLAQMMLLHFTHEDQFLEKLSASSFQKRHRDANVELTAQLFGIEAGLEQAKTAAVFQLLLLGRVWMKEHLGMETEEFECEALIEKESPFLVSGALVAHSQMQGQSSPHAAHELNGKSVCWD
jgi:hemerythrin